MKTLEYRGSGTREISSEDWTSLGIKSKEISARQGDLIDVNDSAAAWLVENESANWRELSEKEADKRRADAEKAEAAAAKEAEAAAAAEADETPRDLPEG